MLPLGVEPRSSVPETDVLSIELRELTNGVSLARVFPLVVRSNEKGIEAIWQVLMIKEGFFLEKELTNDWEGGK